MGNGLDSASATDPNISASERAFRLGWLAALRRTDGARPAVSADYVARQGKAIRVVDLRNADELVGALGHVPGTDWVPLHEAGDLHRRVGAFEPLVLVCEDGTRSLTVASWLEEAGLKLVAAMDGGIRGWREAGLAVARHPAIIDRRGELSGMPNWAGDGKQGALTLDEIIAHVGDPHSIRWLKVAAFLMHGRLACVDGRDHTAVVGTPGGDAGKFIVALAALEDLTGKTLSRTTIDVLMQRRIDAMGRFAFHTDLAAGDRMIAAIRRDVRTASSVAGISDPVRFRAYFSAPPSEVRGPLAEIMVEPAHLGCGHLRLMTQHPERWGVRAGLTQQVLGAAISLRWQGVRDLEITPLPGGHAEGAVVNVLVPDELSAFSSVPLVAPSIDGRQMFVNHPAVATFIRRQLAMWLSQQNDLFTPPSREELAARMQQIHEKQLNATLGELAAGLPIYNVTVHPTGASQVEHVGDVPRKAA